LQKITTAINTPVKTYLFVQNILKQRVKQQSGCTCTVPYFTTSKVSRYSTVNSKIICSTKTKIITLQRMSENQHSKHKIKNMKMSSTLSIISSLVL